MDEDADLLAGPILHRGLEAGVQAVELRVEQTHLGEGDCNQGGIFFGGGGGVT